MATMPTMQPMPATISGMATRAERQGGERLGVVAADHHHADHRHHDEPGAAQHHRPGQRPERAPVADEAAAPAARQRCAMIVMARDPSPTAATAVVGRSGVPARWRRLSA